MSSLKLIWHHHALYSLQSWHQIAPDSQFPLNHYKYHYQCNSATLYWYPINSSHHTGSVPTSKPAVILGLWFNNYRATKGQLLVSILAAFPSLFFTNRPSRLVGPNLVHNGVIRGEPIECDRNWWQSSIVRWGVAVLFCDVQSATHFCSGQNIQV